MASTVCNSDEAATLSTLLSTTSTIPHGGFDYELLGNTDARYECPICLLYMRNPVITSCGHRFCSACISQWTVNQNNLNGCPVDGTKLSGEHIFPDNCTRREILACKAKCPYLKEGCSAIVTLSEMDIHVENHHTLSLSSSLGSMKMNGSTSNGNGNAECVFKEFGCVGVFHPEQLKRHLETDVHHHLQLCTASYKRLKKMLTRPPGMKYPSPRDMYTRQGSGDSTRWLLYDDMDSDEYNFRRQGSWDCERFARRYNSRPHYPERLAESDESISKASFQSSDKQTRCSTSCQSILTPSNNDEIQLKDLFERIVKLEQNDREKQIKIDRLESQLTSAFRLFDKVSQLMDNLTARYCNGTFIWKVTEFRKQCEELRKSPTKAMISPDFYTDTFGYKLCLKFNLTPHKQPNANASPAVPVDVPLHMDETTQIGLFVHFVQGEFDDAIPWPFRGELKLSIVHPKSPEKSLTESIRSKPEAAAAAFTKPTLPRNLKGIGYPDMCSLQRIFAEGFVQNDCLYFTIVAKTATTVA